MKALFLDAEWRPREGYRLNEREKKTKRGYVEVGLGLSLFMQKCAVSTDGWR